MAALVLPPLSGRVVDDAGILSVPTREALTGKLAGLEAKTTDQLVVVTLKSLQGTSIEDFGVQLGRAWRIGQKDKNNGALLIVAPTERKVRIEVGYGLEATLTDAITKIIIENSIIPRFRAGDFPGGVVRGVDDIISAITDNAEWKQRAQKRSHESDTLGFVIILVLLFGVVGLVILFIVRSLFRPHVSGAKAAKTSRHHGGTLATAGASGWSPSSSDSSSSSSSDSGFSGGGGDFGGGGSSGSW